MLRRTVYNTTVSKFSQIQKDERFISILPLPRRILKKMKSKLTLEYNKLTNTGDEEKNVVNDYYKTSLYVRIMLFQTLLLSINIKPTEESNALFKHYFKKDFDEGSVKLIEDKIAKLQSLFEAETENYNQAPFDFDNYVATIERMQDKKDLSNVYLYQLSVYEQAAISNNTKKES